MTERAVEAETQQEQDDKQAVISVLHSLDNKPPPDFDRSKSWQFWK
jgi:hypothetical protein